MIVEFGCGLPAALGWLLLFLALAGCSSDGAPASGDAGPVADAASPADQVSPVDAGDDPDDASSQDLGPGPDSLQPDTNDPLAGVSCSSTPPAGAQLAAPPPSYSNGTCPQLVEGLNSIASGADQRQFLLLLPGNPQPGERFPLLFAWHWLKGSAKSFADLGEMAQATDDQRFIAVVPESRGDIDLFGLIDLPWPFTTLDTEQRMQQEYTFFDDLLACVSAQFPVNKECVSSVGVSAGAMFTVQLAHARSQHLASFISLSGGTGGGGGVNDFIRQWPGPPAHRLPALVLWGGPHDTCATLNFQTASQRLEQQLVAGGHFFVECIHNCKHGEPPLDPPAGVSQYAPIWEFVFAHPFWLPAGQSPIVGREPLLDHLPWCGVGPGSATIRSGSDCPPPGCPI